MVISLGNYWRTRRAEILSYAQGQASRLSGCLPVFMTGPYLYAAILSRGSTIGLEYVGRSDYVDTILARLLRSGLKVALFEDDNAGGWKKPKKFVLSSSVRPKKPTVKNLKYALTT